LSTGPVYDLVVVGAGIHGAGVAQAAAVKGYSVLVIEKREAAALETSRASSKLIHGGLRYLETAQFRLVYECLREQRLLLRNAPQLVQRQAFYIPVYSDSQRHPWWIFLGLNCYRLLAGWRRDNAIQRIEREQWPQLGINRDNLLAVFRYFDAQTDDQQLTRAVMRSAEYFGAQVRYNSVLVKTQKVNVYQLQLNDGSQILCRALVNAAGPWANEIAETVGAPQQPLDWVQGAHIVLRQPSFSGCFYLEAPQDKRAVFVLPWKGHTMVGTTETLLKVPRAEPTQAEIDYLLQVYNHYFPQFLQEPQDILEIFAGVRVLPKDQRNANQRSRETIFVSNADKTYVGIYGGKLTSYRSTADKVLKVLIPVLGVGSKMAISTADVVLP
jgi:glycerol-3-phosphate dehydrogenase